MGVVFTAEINPRGKGVRLLCVFFRYPWVIMRSRVEFAVDYWVWRISEEEDMNAHIYRRRESVREFNTTSLLFQSVTISHSMLTACACVG